MFAEYAAIDAEDDDPEPTPFGVVPAEWIDGRCIGSATLDGNYVELGHHETLAELRRDLAGRLVHHGVAELDAAAIRLTSPRALTQEISRHIFDNTTAGVRQWNGISYLSKYGDDLDNWAIFEPDTPTVTAVADLDLGDQDLAVALRLHGLRMATETPDDA